MRAPYLSSLNDARRLMREGSVSPAQLMHACLDQIDRLNPRLNAFITLIPAPADGDPCLSLAAAQGPDVLAAIPIAIKDMIETAGVRTTAGSLFFKEYLPPDDAVAVQRLKRAGAILLGKTNTHEIALGVTTQNPHFGACRNPWDESRIPGGSSGGSAVAVSTGMALGALGTDTGGSIRIPASLCGIVGLKPTYGRVSTRGVFPLSWNLDHVGPLTRTVADAALMLQAIAGYDPDDPYSLDVPTEDYSARFHEGVRGWRVALGAGAYVEDADAQVLGAVHKAADVFQDLGAQVRRVDVSFLREAAIANGLMTQADGAAYHHQRLAEHPGWFGEDVRKRLEAGRDLPSADYVMARHTQADIRRHLHRFFEDHDLLLLPSTPITAPPIVGGDAVDQARRLTRFTAPFNLSGLPAISVPCGITREGLPIGLQMVAGGWEEAKLLRAAASYEQASEWGRRQPPGI